MVEEEEEKKLYER